ncbi:MAG: efflux RND transporter periplasmic adaptor subunit [Bacteroidia bacterium]
MYKNILWAFCGLMILSACGNKNMQADAEAFEVVALELQPRDTTVEIRYVAELQAQGYVEVRARHAGMLEAILVDEGQLVKSGQVMFKLTSTELESVVASAKAAVLLTEAELKKARLERQRVRSLVDNQVVAATELDLAEAEVQIAKARLEDAMADLKTAEAQLSYTSVKAPFIGKVNRFALKMGARVAEGDLLTTLSDATGILAYFNISEKEYLKNRTALATGGSAIPRQARLVLADGSAYAHDGQIETAETEFDPVTGAMALRARFPNPEGLLKHRSTGQILLVMEQKDVFLVPQKAVLELQDKYYVYVIGGNQLLRLQAVRPISRVGGFYVVNQGIEAGTWIVAEGIMSVREGMKVAGVERIEAIDTSI